MCFQLYSTRARRRPARPQHTRSLGDEGLARQVPRRTQRIHSRPKKMEAHTATRIHAGAV